MSNRLLKTLPGGQGRAEAATGPPRAFQVQPEQLDKPYATTKGQSPVKFPSAVIQLWDIKKVIPNQNNPRRHPKKQIKKLVRSLRKFGFVRPVFVDQNGNVISGEAML